MEFDTDELIGIGLESDVNPTKMLMIMSKASKCGCSNAETFKMLYEEIFGRTLCKKFCHKMVESMHHGDDRGRKWTVEQTNELARKNDIEFGTDYTEDEFNAVVHMMWYDYHSDLKESGITSDNIYAKMADSYLVDEDAPEGKLVNYFFFLNS